MSDAEIPIEDKINALKGALRWREEVLLLRAERDRLQKDLDELTEMYARQGLSAFNANKERIVEVEAENDRLREALTLSDEIIADLSQRVIQLSLWKERVTGGALAKEAGQ
jgi:predicted nuclease with TOPRIM domain